MSSSLHTEFINAVKKGRGKRLKANNALFTGLIWTGTQAKKLGLIDGFGSSSYVARNIIKAPKLMDYTVKNNYFERLANRVGVTTGEEFAKTIGLKANTQISG